MRTHRIVLALAAISFYGFFHGPCALADNIAGLGTPIFGVKTAIDGTNGTVRLHAGDLSNINDGNTGTGIDNWWVGGEVYGAVSYVGIIWPELRFDSINNVTLTMALFSDGGWFGVPGRTPPGPVQTLSAATNLVTPTVQVTTNFGTTWTTVNCTSDYLTAMDGVAVPGSGTANFAFDPPLTQINGMRLIGTNGGVGADTNGFLGVFELEIDATAAVDSDGDGLPDSWMIRYFGHADPRASDLSRAGDDPDGDGLTNAQEYSAGTDPRNTDTDGDGLTDAQEVNVNLTSPTRADTDGDGLSDGDEVKTYHTDPLLRDTDNDGLSDGDEILKYHSNPLVVDSDGDGFADGLEVSQGTDPANAAIFPSNLALIGTGIMGTRPTIDSGDETPLFHVGVAGNINDGNLGTRVDTYNDSGTDKASFVGILWDKPISTPLVRLELTIAAFLDGGWFGKNNAGPGAGGLLTTNYLIEPTVQVTVDGGTTWTNLPHTSDYLSALNRRGIGGGVNPNPTSLSCVFMLTNTVTGTNGISGINGIRIIGSEGGTASGGFLGVFELAALVASTDSDHDGMLDDWERLHGLVVGVNDSNSDGDNDGLPAIEEYKAGTDPQVADTDGDGLNDGLEVKTYHTNPLQVDTDGDGLTDGAEALTYHTNPLSKDTDGDGFTDSEEVALGSDPTDPTSYPDDIAILGTGILGTRDTVDSGVETPFFHAGALSSINDGDLTTSVDTFNGGDGGTASYVGIVWDQMVAGPVSRFELSLATFFDGGWFGVNDIGPGPSGMLTVAEDLLEPIVQISTDHGTNWTTVDHTSDYLTALEGHTLPAAFGAPTLATASFQLTASQTNFNGLRIIGSEGGSASGGFLGVFELVVHGPTSPQAPHARLVNSAMANGQFRFEFTSKPGITYEVQFSTSLAPSNWQVLTNIVGDGSVKQVTDSLTGPSRFYRLRNQ